MQIILLITLVLGANLVSALNETDQIVDEWIEKGYIVGFDNCVNLDKALTRAQFISFVNRVYKLEEKEDAIFIDISTKDWFYNEVRRGIAGGYINGYLDNTFRPHQNITRIELAAFISRMFNIEHFLDDSTIDTSKVPAWGINAAKACINAGIFEGVIVDQFNPNEIVKREEAILVIDRAFKISKFYIISNCGDYDFKNENHNNLLILADNVSIRNAKLENLVFKGSQIRLENVHIKDSLEIGYEKIFQEKIYDITIINDESLLISSENALQDIAISSEQELILTGEFNDVTIFDKVKNLKLTRSTHAKIMRIYQAPDPIDIILRPLARIDKLYLDRQANFYDIGLIREALGNKVKVANFYRLPQNLIKYQPLKPQKPQEKEIEYKITFYDFHDEITYEFMITKGSSVSPPKPLLIKGYRFKKWSEELINICRDLNVYPIYEKLDKKVTYVLNETLEEFDKEFFFIDDNSIIGFFTVAVNLDKLPDYLQIADNYNLVQNMRTHSFKENMFNTSIYYLNLPDTLSKETIKTYILEIEFE